MRYEYAYKTPDGVRHVEEIDAPSRDEAFSMLRAKGIKAIKVVAKDGSKANGEVRVIGVKKRVAAILAVVTGIFASIVATILGRRTADPIIEQVIVTNTIPVSASQRIRQRIAMPLPRQMIQGDRHRIEATPTNLFGNIVEKYLSRFAEPGRSFGDEIAVSLVSNEVQLLEFLNAPIYISDTDFTEHIDLKRITAGLKREMRNYLRGGHTETEYLEALIERQRTEIGYRKKAEKKLSEMISEKTEDKQDIYEFWLKANAQLQSMGIYPLPLPDLLRDFQFSLDLELL